MAATAAAPALPRSCSSDDDCGSNEARGLCLPKAGTKQLADAEDFLGRVMSLHDLVTRLGDTSSSAPLPTIHQQVRDDILKYGHLKQGRAADGTDVAGQGAPLTRDQMREMQDAAWMQSGATQAEWSVVQFARDISAASLKTDALKVSADITGDSGGLHLDQVIDDLQAFLHDIEVAGAPVNKLITLREANGGPLTPKSGAGALLVYMGPVMKEIDDAKSGVNAFLDPVTLPQLKKELAALSRAHDLLGRDGNAGTCLGAR